MLDCILISSDESFRNSVLGMIREPGAQCRLVMDLQSSIAGLDKVNAGKVLQGGARVAFLDLGTDTTGVRGIHALSQEAPELAIIVAGPELSADGLLTVMRAGASEYLPRPFSREDLQEAFARVRRRTRASSSETQAAPGRVTTVFSAKGGTGVTTVATNLAVALRRLTLKQVLLVDLSPSMGTVAVSMGLEPRYTYLDLIQNFHRVDEELFRSFLEVHDSGVHVLSSPIAPGDAVLPSRDDVYGLVRLCQKHFEFVVFDGGTTVSSQLLTLLQESDDRLMVVTPDLPALRNLKRALELLGRKNGKTSARLVLNQYREGVGLSDREVEDGLGQPVAVTLDFEATSVLESVNMGRPDVVAGKSRFAKSMMKFGARMAGPEMVVLRKKGLLGRLVSSSKGKTRNGKERQ